jgi:hypothetical protein
MQYHPIRWSKYTLPNGREVCLTQRPDFVDVASLGKFLRRSKPIVRFCFCDDMVVFPEGIATDAVAYHWYPWFPSKNLPLECVFPFVTLMDRYVKSAEEGIIWLHCDSSSMRAPTYFGLYLATHFPDQLVEICEKMTVFPTEDYDYAQHSRADKYLKISLDRDPGMADFVKWWEKDPTLAWQYCMGHKYGLEET